MARVRFKGGKAVGAIHLANNTIVDGDFFTIGNKVYEFDDNASVTAGRVAITIGGSAALTRDAIIAAINANKPSKPVTAVIDPKNASGEKINLFADQVGAAGNIVLTENVADAGFTVRAATLEGGENGGEQTMARGEYTVKTMDVTADNVMIETGLTSPRFAIVQARSSAGVPKAHTAEISISGSKIRLNFAGATDLAATDVVTWIAWE
jgi:hypothetical protein